MTTIGRRVDDDVRKKRVDKVVDISIEPTGRIRRWRRHSIRRMDVGFKGRWGGGGGESAGREIRGHYSSCNWGHGVPHKHTML